MAVRKFAIAVLIVGGLATSLVAQSDEGRDRPRVSTEMHGADAAHPGPVPEKTGVPETLSVVMKPMSKSRTFQADICVKPSTTRSATLQIRSTPVRKRQTATQQRARAPFVLATPWRAGQAPSNVR